MEKKKKIWGKFKASKGVNKKLKRLALKEGITLCELVSKIVKKSL